MAEDSHVPPLPRRVRGDARGSGTGRPVAPLVLPGPVVQQILSVLDAVRAEASPQDHPAGAERPAQDNTALSKRPPSLPRRVPGASNVREPPALIARPVLRASLPRFRSENAPTAPLTAIPTSKASGNTEQDGVQPDIAAQPGPATAGPTDHRLVSALRAPAEERPDRQIRRDEVPARPEKAPPSQKEVPALRNNVQASRGKAPAHQAAALTGPPKPARPQARARRHRGISGGVILVVVLLCAGSLGFLLTRHGATATTANGHMTSASGKVAIRDRAAAWVAGQVSRAAVVSCDRVMCQALEAHGVPAASLLELEPGKADPLRSTIIVATAAVRSLIGSRHVTADAPAAIASFGSGNIRIDIRTIAPRGAAAYFSALSTDILALKASGTQLLGNPRITVSATARRQLADGQVDPRLLAVMAGLAAQRPVSVVTFGDLAPGASPGIPLRAADLAQTGGTAGPNPAAQMRWMVAFLRAQRDPYLAAHIQTVRLAGGPEVLRIEFAAPSPLGLLGPRAQ
jgi:hypothetical protein